MVAKALHDECARPGLRYEIPLTNLIGLLPFGSNSLTAPLRRPGALNALYPARNAVPSIRFRAIARFF